MCLAVGIVSAQSADVDWELEAAKSLYREARFGQAAAKLQGVILHLERLDQALAQKEQLADAHLHLALTYVALNDSSAAKKSLEAFDFDAIPALNRKLVLDLARCEFVGRRENIIALGPSGVGKTHIAIGLGLAACQRGIKTRFTTAAAIVHELIEARDDKRLLRLQKQLAGHELLIIDELGFVPLSKTGAELLFELVGQRYERGATIITSNLPFDEWTATFGDERLTGALLDRLTHHVHILEMNGQSYRLAQSRSKRKR